MTNKQNDENINEFLDKNGKEDKNTVEKDE